MGLIDTNYPTSSEKATPEYVLAVFQDLHRHAAAIDPDVERDSELSFETTIQEWRLICDLLPWRELALEYNKLFEINCSKDRWRVVLEPAKTRTLLDVCNLVASEATRPKIRPAHLLGPPCRTAGAFLTVRSILQDQGAIGSNITPASDLLDYARLHWKPLLYSLIRIAPGALPTLHIRTPLYDAFIFGLLLALLSLMVSAMLMAPLGMLVSVVMGICCYVGVNLAAKLPPKSVEIRGLKTFRALSALLAGADNSEKASE
jgi:hypothetical protein